MRSGTDTIAAEARPATSLIDVVRDRAADDPNAIVYRFPERPNGPAVVLTTGDLDRLARSVAAELQAHHERGDRVLLLLPPGRAFVLGFFGAVLAGLVPIPAPAPSRVRLARTLPDVLRVARDCRPSALLTTSAIASAMAEVPADDGLEGVCRHELDRDLRGTSRHWVDPELTGSDTAFLQYTSGSTSDPRGVVVTQASLLANLAAIHDAFQLAGHTRLVTWLPPHHDMGLVGGLLTPMRSCYEATVLTPADFVQSPVRWLQAITEQQATLSGGPDFAYRLCAERIRDEQLEGVDLSSWQIAFTGAEPISPGTISAFSDRFAAVGFRREAFYPCYGLAESTLMVTGGTAFSGPVRQTLSRRALRDDGRARPPSDEADERELISSGRAVGEGTEVVIVDPARRTVLPEAEVGEIWVRGPSVAAGYFGRARETVATFGAQLADSDGPFLRTGDLGLLLDGELLVTGRLKDVIIVAGRTLDAHDVEAAIRAAVPMHPQAMTAALCTFDGGHERFVVAHEVARRLDGPPEQVVRAVQAAVTAHCDLRPDAVVLVRLGSLPRTTSGKLRRAEAARRFGTGELTVIDPVTVTPTTGAALSG